MNDFNVLEQEFFNTIKAIQPGFNHEMRRLCDGTIDFEIGRVKLTGRKYKIQLQLDDGAIWLTGTKEDIFNAIPLMLSATLQSVMLTSSNKKKLIYIGSDDAI